MRRQTASESVWVVVAAVMTGGCLHAQSAPAAEYIYLGERMVAIERPVVAGIIAVSVAPNPTSVVSGSSLSFTANVANATNQSVTWSVVTPNGGTITAAGVYTAPSGVSANMQVVVRATSVQDATKSGEAQVTVTPAAAGSCTISPTTATFSSRGQAKTVAVTCPAGTAWATVNEFAAHGAAAKVTLGNEVVERWTWSGARQQARRLEVGTEGIPDRVGKLEWSYCVGGGADMECASNNGNVMAQWVQPVNEAQTYGYDSRNRLTSGEGKSGTTVNWRETASYDGRGNRAVTGTRVGLPGLTGQTPDQLTDYNDKNRVTAWTYDAAGNVLGLGASTGEYDGENRLWRRTNTVTGRQSVYVYDGEGRRVMKTDGTDVWWYVYEAGGKLAAEYGPSGPVGGTQYVTQDHLGSTRMVTGTGGGVVRRYDYLPFGEALLAGVGARTVGQGYETADDAGTVRQRFTGKERDAEMGLDYFPARYKMYCDPGNQRARPGWPHGFHLGGRCGFA